MLFFFKNEGSFRLIRPLFIVWNRLKPFEQFALKVSFGPWTVWWTEKCIIWRKMLEFFIKKLNFFSTEERM